MELHKLFAGAVVATFMMLAMISQAEALGIAPAIIEKTFSPGMESMFNIKIINSDKRKFDIKLSPDGELARYITIEPSEFTIKENEQYKKVSVHIKLPDNIGEPGPHQARILINQKVEPGKRSITKISANVIVYGIIKVDVPFPGKYAKIHLIAPNFRVGTKSSFGIEINNMGTEPFFADSIITVKSPLEETIASLKGRRIPIKPRRQELVSIPWTPKHAGNFRAISDVLYDKDKFARDEKEFSIGEPEVDVFTISAENFRKGGISKFETIIESKWNKMIDDVYANFVIMDSGGNLISKYTSGHVSVPPLGTQVIPAYIETAKLEDKNYIMKVTLHYLGKEKKKSFNIKITGDSINIEGTGKMISEKPKEKTEAENIYNLIYVVILLIILSNIALYKKLSGQRKQEYLHNS